VPRRSFEWFVSELHDCWGIAQGDRLEQAVDQAISDIKSADPGTRAKGSRVLRGIENDSKQWTCYAGFDLRQLWEVLPQGELDRIASILRGVARETARRLASEGVQPRRERTALRNEQKRVARRIESTLDQVEDELTKRMQEVHALCTHGQQPAIRKQFRFRANGRWGRTWRALDRVLQAVETTRPYVEDRVRAGTHPRPGRYPAPVKKQAILDLDQILAAHIPAARVHDKMALLLWLAGAERTVAPRGEPLRVRASELRRAPQ
jgi:hypothetical protein